MRLVVQAEGLVGVLHKLVHRERAVVRLDDRVRDLRRRHDRERQHHAVRVLLADLGDQKRAHASAGAAAEGVRDPGGARLHFDFFDTKDNKTISTRVR